MLELQETNRITYDYAWNEFIRNRQMIKQRFDEAKCHARKDRVFFDLTEFIPDDLYNELARRYNTNFLEREQSEYEDDYEMDDDD